MRSSWLGKLCLFTTSVVMGSNLVVTSARGETSGLGISDDASVAFAWNANTESNLAGYRLYVGTLPGVYAGYVEVGLKTSYQVSDLVRGTTYFFALTAYNTAGLESDFTPELTRTIPLVIGSVPNGIDAGGIAGSMTNLVEQSETNGLTSHVLPAEPVPPEIARVADQWIVRSWVSLPIRLSILDPDTPPEALEVVAT